MIVEGKIGKAMKYYILLTAEVIGYAIGFVLLCLLILGILGEVLDG